VPERRLLRLATTTERAGVRLDGVLAAWLPAALGRSLSKSALRRLIMAGAVRVDGRPLRLPGRPIDAGRRVEVQVRAEALAEPAPPRHLGRGGILFEDAAIVAVDKPPGLSFHAGADPSRPHLVGLVQRLVGQSYLGVHHRLDRDTSGVVIFAKDAAANPGLAAAFEGRRVVKVYHALTRAGRPPRGWEATGAVAERAARTSFRVREAHPRGLLVDARPSTGRKHQIRVHLAAAGLPILGDGVYGSAADAAAAPRVMLHAVRLELPHPLTGAPLVIESPYPDDFRRVLESLRRGAVERPRRSPARPAGDGARRGRRRGRGPRR
jgi:RluA family pseudouridine synthase